MAATVDIRAMMERRIKQYLDQAKVAEMQAVANEAAAKALQVIIQDAEKMAEGTE